MSLEAFFIGCFGGFFILAFMGLMCLAWIQLQTEEAYVGNARDRY